MGILFGALCGVGAVASAQNFQSVLNASLDTSIFEEDADASAGVGPFILAGVTGSRNSPDFQARRGLIRFDLAGVLPADAVLTNVQLELTVAKVPDEVFNFTTQSLHRLTAEWGAPAEPGSGSTSNPGKGTPAVAGDATWSHRLYDTATWAQAGGDFVAESSASTGVGPTVNAVAAWSGAGLLEDVQLWLDDPSMNLGWILIGNEGGAFTQNARGYYSRDNTDPSAEGNLPRLRLTYEIVPEPAEAGLLLGLLAAGLLGKRRRHSLSGLRR